MFGERELGAGQLLQKKDKIIENLKKIVGFPCGQKNLIEMMHPRACIGKEEF